MTPTRYRDMMTDLLNDSYIKDQHIRRELVSIAAKADASTSEETDATVLQEITVAIRWTEKDYVRSLLAHLYKAIITDIGNGTALTARDIIDHFFLDRATRYTDAYEWSLTAEEKTMLLKMADDLDKAKCPSDTLTVFTRMRNAYGKYSSVVDGILEDITDDINECLSEFEEPYEL
jgi:hypothetical protein|nr:MAG TPA: hypothetical protein [Caudoviricetes sp.]